MQLGMIGLGRMGANMVRRLMDAGHECVVFDLDAAARDALATEGAHAVSSARELVDALTPPRAVWLMVPAGITARVADETAALLGDGDAIVDGGNSYYRHAVDRAGLLAGRGIAHLDVGTSGGVHGLERGYCLMVGGDARAVERLAPIFDALAPGHEAASRTAGRAGAVAREEQGWVHCGPAGAGHFVKMVHNGIEYGVMAAYAEGLAILHGANAGSAGTAHDAETAPLLQPEYYRFDIDVAAIAEVWRRGSVIGSWLLDLTAAALHADPRLDAFAGRVSDSGEGRWTVMSAIEESVPTPVIAAALFSRFASRGEGDYAGKVLSAMRAQFGGHQERGG